MLRKVKFVDRDRSVVEAPLMLGVTVHIGLNPTNALGSKWVKVQAAMLAAKW